MFLRKIEDINITNSKISITRDASISIEDLEKQITRIKYEPANGSKDTDAENIKVPPFIQVFYFLFFSYLKIPSENDFWNTYLSWVKADTENNELEIDGTKHKLDGLRNRLNRTYPSLIRDIHFLYLLEASKKFQQVHYSMNRDYYNGLDLRITQNNIDVYVSLFIDTLRGRYFKQKKTERHDYSTVHEIEFSVNFDSLTQKGAIYLLNQEHVIQLETILNETK